MDDPDERAVLYVQQHLKESGFTRTLAVFEEECGLLYDEDKYKRGSELLQLIYTQMEQEAEQSELQDAASKARAEEERALVRSGKGDLPTTSLHRIAGVHNANVLVVRIWPGRDLLATGAADGSVHLLRFDGTPVWSTLVATGGAISLEWSPAITLAITNTLDDSEVDTSEVPQSEAPDHERDLSGRPMMVVGSMDGSVSVLDAATGQLLGSCKPHAKYVVRAAFDPRGKVLATASFDQSCCLLRLVEDGKGLNLEVLRQVHHGAAVQDVAFVPPKAAAAAAAVADDTASADAGGTGGEGPASKVLVAVRGSTSLFVLDADAGNDLPQISLHARDDDHLQFSPMRLAFSPCGKYLLVALDGPRLLILRTSDWTRARALYGLHVQQFHNHALAWHHDSAYAYATAENAAVFVYHVGTGKVVARLEGYHRINVRDVDVDCRRNLLATCSFDRTVRVFGCRSV